MRLRILHRIAQTIGVDVSTFFTATPGDTSDKPRSRLEQADALLRTFEEIDDPRAREGLIALIEAEARIAREMVG